MKRREKTSDERTFDKLLRGGIMHLGKQPAQAAAPPNPFPYVMFWGTKGRKGQRCRIVTLQRSTLSPLKFVEIEFIDGHRDRVNRMALRQAEGTCSSSSSSC